MFSRCATIVMGGGILLALLAVALTNATNSGSAQPVGRTASQDQQGKERRQADNGGAQPAGKGDTKKPVVAKKPLQILEERVDVKDLQQPIRLKEVLELLHDFLSNRGMELDIIVDRAVFKEEAGPDAPDIYETQVQLPALPKKLTVAMLLRQVLNQVPNINATYLVFSDHILVTTTTRSGIDSLLLQHVTGIYENRPFGQLLRELGEKTAVTIVIDRRVGDKEERAVSVTFQRDATLAGVLRVLTEMVDLKVVVLDGIIFVTTPSHAEQLRKEQKQQEKDRFLLWPISEFLDPRPLAAPPLMQGEPGLPGFPGFPPFIDPRTSPTPVDAPPNFRKKDAAAA